MGAQCWSMRSVFRLTNSSCVYRGPGLKLKLLRQQGFRLEGLDLGKLSTLQESTSMAAKAVEEMLAVKSEQHRSLSGAENFV